MTLVNKNMAFDKFCLLANWYYEVQEVGLNYRASDLNCALGLSQLAKYEKFLTTKKLLASTYDSIFGDHSSLLMPCPRENKDEDAYHLYPILINFEKFNITRQIFMAHLKSKGIGSQVHYIPMHLQPLYKDDPKQLSLLGAETFYERTISIPLHTKLSIKDVTFIAYEIIDFLLSKQKH